MCRHADVGVALYRFRTPNLDKCVHSQPDARTIKGVLFDALVRVGAVSSDNADDPTKVGLGCAAHTDARAHSAGNLVSTQIPDVPDVVEAVNELLSLEIRVWRIIPVQNSFNAQTCAFLPQLYLGYS